ncbi:MAG: DUF2892 domain-containing protein [Bacteroidota bacterium]
MSHLLTWSYETVYALQIIAGLPDLCNDHHQLSFRDKGHYLASKFKHMKKNMSNVDRTVRLVLAVVFGVLYFAGIVPGTVGLILTILGGVFLFTSAISFCPLYALVGLSTCPNPQA